MLYKPQWTHQHHALKLLYTWAVPTSCVYVCVCPCGKLGGVVGGTRQDKEDREAEEVIESVSGSPTAGLWILYFYSGLPALLTDALMKDKTELDRKHKQTHTLIHILEGEMGERLSCSKKVTL